MNSLMDEVTKRFLREVVQTEGDIWDLADLKKKKEELLLRKHDRLVAIENLMNRERGRNVQHYKQALAIHENVRSEIRELQIALKDIDDKLQAAWIFFRQSKEAITIDLGKPAESPW